MSLMGSKHHLVVKSSDDETPEGCEWRGEYYDWGGKQKKVFWEKVTPTKLVPLIDPLTNGPLLKRGPSGNATGRYHTDRVPDGEPYWREFIQVPTGNGTTHKQYTFREDPAEIERKRRAALRQKALDELLDRAVDAGGIDNLMASAIEEATAPDAA